MSAKRKASPQRRKGAEKAAPLPGPLPKAEREKSDQGSTESRPTSVRPTNKGGRPAKITAAVVEEVAGYMADGVPEHYACALVGVNPETFGPAVSRNPAFRAIKDRHDARFIADSCQHIKNGGEKVTLITGQDEQGKNLVVEKILPWTGRAWLLERRYKPHFNKTDTHALTDKTGQKDAAYELSEIEKVIRAQVLGGKATTDGH